MLGQVARGGAGNSSQKADYQYDDSDGYVTKITYGNGAYAIYAYDGSGALTKISHYIDAYPTDTLIASNAYEFDAAGNVTKVVLDDGFGPNQTGDAVVTYQYDDLYRLTREYCAPAQGSDRTQYGYEYWFDAVGNRTKMRFYNAATLSWETSEYSYSARNELEWESTPEGGAWDLFYDARGNLTKKADSEYPEYYFTDYYWDSQDRLTKVYWFDDTLGIDRTVEYKYDLMGRRVAKRVKPSWWQSWTAWRWYFYDGLKVIAEGTGTNDKIFYTNGPGAIGGIISRDNNGTKYWFHYDRLGNVVGVTDSNGAVVSLYTMEAFGNVLEMTNGGDFSNERSSDVQPYHLTTKEYDADSGLYYFNARWYDRTTGRSATHPPAALLHNGRPAARLNCPAADSTTRDDPPSALRD